MVFFFFIKVLFHWSRSVFPALLPRMPSSPGQREYSPTPRGSPEESQLSGEMQKVEAGGGPLKTKVGLLHPVYQPSGMGQEAQRMLAWRDSLMLPKGRGLHGGLRRVEAGPPWPETKTGGHLQEVCQHKILHLDPLLKQMRVGGLV